MASTKGQRPRRWPAGTWMRLRSGGALREQMDRQGKSLADVARYAGVSRGFISHLTAGREKTCSPKVAQRIADLLGVGLELLFEVQVPPASGRGDKSQAA